MASTSTASTTRTVPATETVIDASSVGTASIGTTTIVDPVVAKIAGIAAREVPGVYALGGGAARVLGNIREAIGTKDLTQGIKVEVGETQVAIDITIVAEYPQPLQVVADGVRSAVAAAITGLVGLEVAEINVTITDVHIPGEDDAAAEPEARVL